MSAATAASFVERRLTVTFTLQPHQDNQGNTVTPTFDGSSNQATYSGLRVSAHIEKGGQLDMGNMQLRIYGLPLSDMNKLSTLGLIPGNRTNNTVALMAGDDTNGMSIVFVGSIINAFADFGGTPDVFFSLYAATGVFGALNPVPPSSFQGSVDAADVLAGLARQLGVAFENHGVSVILSNPYLPSTLFAQVESCAHAAGIEWVLDDQTLAIWPKTGSRGSTAGIPLISPTTGMVGYPAFDRQGIIVKALFNPVIKFGSQVQVQSSLTPACGKWTVYRLHYDLESETPGGAWFQEMLASPPGQAPTR